MRKESYPNRMEANRPNIAAAISELSINLLVKEIKEKMKNRPQSMAARKKSVQPQCTRGNSRSYFVAKIRKRMRQYMNSEMEKPMYPGVHEAA